MGHQIQNQTFRTSFGQFCDYIPLISTVNNLIGLFQQVVIIPRKAPAIVRDNHYYSYLKNKSLARTVLLMIPVLGNILIAIYDFSQRKYDNPEYMLQQIKNDFKQFKNASYRLRNDRDFVSSCLSMNRADVAQEKPREECYKVEAAFIMEHVSTFLQNDTFIVDAAMLTDGNAIKFVSEEMQAKSDVALMAFMSARDSILYLHPNLRTNEEAMLKLINVDAYACKMACKDLKSSKEFALKAIKKNPIVYLHLEHPLNLDFEVVREVARKVLENKLIPEIRPFHTNLVRLSQLSRGQKRAREVEDVYGESRDVSPIDAKDCSDAIKLLVPIL